MSDGASLKAKERRQTAERLIDHRRRDDPDWVSTPGLPINTAEMVSQYDASDRQPGRQLDLERVTLHLTRDRTDEGKPGATVVRGRGQHQGRTTTGLLTAGLRIERQPDEVAATGRPRSLRRGGREVAVLRPARSARRLRRREPSPADVEAFRMSAGSWKDNVDVEQFLKNIYESRDRPSRPPVEL